jgi:hypothetical protein
MTLFLNYFFFLKVISVLITLVSGLENITFKLLNVIFEYFKKIKY